MIVADTSALLSLAAGDVLDEFDVHTTQSVVTELENTSEYEDVHADAATAVLEQQDELSIHQMDNDRFTSSRIDDGEASCIELSEEVEADFLITDDLRAVPELQNLVDAKVAISPIVLKALVKRSVLTNEEAKNQLQQIAETRDWLGAPIYRRAQQLFEQ